MQYGDYVFFDNMYVRLSGMVILTDFSVISVLKKNLAHYEIRVSN